MCPFPAVEWLTPAILLQLSLHHVLGFERIWFYCLLPSHFLRTHGRLSVCDLLCTFLPAPLSQNPALFSLPFLLAIKQSTFLHIPFSYLADGPSMNTIYTLALHAQSRPSIPLSFPPQIEYQLFPRLHRHAELLPAKILSLFLFSFTHILL